MLTQSALIFDGQQLSAGSIAAQREYPAILYRLDLASNPRSIAAGRWPQSMPCRRPQPVAGPVESPCVALRGVGITNDGGDIGPRFAKRPHKRRPLLTSGVLLARDDAPSHQLEPVQRDVSCSWWRYHDDAKAVAPCHATLGRTEVMMLGKEMRDRTRERPTHDSRQSISG